jgi:hypothetical protein
VNKPERQKRQRRGFIWVSGAVASIAALLYWEQTATLYVLSTLAMCGLLFVVAFADLEGRDKELTEATNREETAPAGGDEVATDAASDAASQPERRVAKRKRPKAA